MSTKNLFSDEAKQKIKDLATEIDFAMFASGLKEYPIHMVPMSTKKVDEEGLIWFLSNRNSQHNQNINLNSAMHLVYSDASKMKFLNVFGQASITTNFEIIKELYKSTDDAWFDGVNDPNITAISVRPDQAFYWDPKNNTLVTLLKMGMGAITGDEPDLMDQGELNI
ncbi:pyridoxamine 5'-phosphate oxidase family protein [Flavobacterium sp.]|uniref:pyridoxamine 5'-phosphate oxidase family protein n=1 Tax=Flavobacterium sp. TaxID=239 RepID=UPI0026161469|nr:pyridoxamine 5'-phosphate oxidase family protein [Flavobacterium sp.]MDG2431461.1 pyridoxamine 5'-phosphate oxidase family protein [Flavobacterium sp.]